MDAKEYKPREDSLNYGENYNERKAYGSLWHILRNM
jgi:hypothetical protein